MEKYYYISAFHIPIRSAPCIFIIIITRYYIITGSYNVTYTNNAINAIQQCCWLLLCAANEGHTWHTVFERRKEKKIMHVNEKGRHTALTHSHTHTFTTLLVSTFLHFVRKQFQIFNFWRNFAEIVFWVIFSVRYIRSCDGVEFIIIFEKFKWENSRQTMFHVKTMPNNVEWELRRFEMEKINFDPQWQRRRWQIIQIIPYGSRLNLENIDYHIWSQNERNKWLRSTTQCP